jgi:hypothetical protein
MQNETNPPQLVADLCSSLVILLGNNRPPYWVSMDVILDVLGVLPAELDEAAAYALAHDLVRGADTRVLSVTLTPAGIALSSSAALKYLPEKQPSPWHGK